MMTSSDESKQNVRPAAVEDNNGQSGLLNRWGGRAVLALQRAYDKLLAGRLNQLQAQVIEQDQEISHLYHDLAEMSTQVEQMNRRLSALEEQVDGQEPPGTGDESK